MLQNSEKTKKVFLLLVQFSLYLFVVITAISFVITKSFNLTNMVSYVGYVSLGVTSFAWIFNQFLWKKPFINKLLVGEYATPVIEGRWHGVLNRDAKDHEFVLEITQTYLSVSCRSFSEHSNSSSVVADLCYDSNHQIHKLFFIWIGSTTNTNEHEAGTCTNAFNGTDILDIIPATKSKPMMIKGKYFTDRQPHQTRGTICVKYVSNERLNSFD